ncbi:uncharacterized protein LOC143272844 [Peromyscus maniculatus bairdii]|uniref:uncharacterized protein LOC143272844 n=1 Tax=Peromyscus maniculatus bairdii TaxID=230844 RepID=UPI003FD0EDCD
MAQRWLLTLQFLRTLKSALCPYPIPLLPLLLHLSSREPLFLNSPDLKPHSDNFHLQILGKWYIHYWVGNMPIPENIKANPLPPFTFVRNIIGQLEFRMNISSPNECIVFKQVLDYNEERPGSYYAWSRHYFQIYLLEREDVSVIQYLDSLQEFNHNMMMLVDRSRVKDPRSLRQFETLTAFIGLNITDIIKPSYDDSCELSRES